MVPKRGFGEVREAVGVIDEYWSRAVNALERIADLLEGSTDENGLIHIYVTPGPEEEEDAVPSGD